MAECGTHTLCYANPGPYATGELTLAEPVIGQADASMLVTADRNFYTWRGFCPAMTSDFSCEPTASLPRTGDLKQYCG